MPELPLTGGCGCGTVRFEVDAPLTAALYCHCTRCQRRTGTAASASAAINASWLRFLSGEELVRAYRPPDGFEKLFCSECGSGLFSRNPQDPSVMGVRLGVLDEPPDVPPSWRQHVGSAASWEPIPDDGLPRFEGRRTTPR
jgi:hypothetical protein